MWWGTWRDHVQGWRQRAAAEPNVLFVEFEEMKKDVSAVIRRVAAFLGIQPLNAEELANVAEKCRFDYMRQHQHIFEMHPPHILQVDGELFISGSVDRSKAIPSDVSDRIARWAAKVSAASA